MNGIRRALEDIAWYVRHLGVVRAARRVARLCLDAASRTIYSRSDLVVHCADLERWPDFTPPGGLTIRPAQTSDLRRLAARLPPSVIRSFRGRMREGQIMFLAEVEEVPAGYAWMCTQPDAKAPASHGLRLEPGEGLHWSSFTFEDFRQRGIYTALQRFSRSYMKARGCVRVYGGADTRNPAPLRMMKRLGLRPVHVCRVRRVLGRRRQWVEPVAPAPKP
jgi:GNAT superfamily N-acetyltransferase